MVAVESEARLRAMSARIENAVGQCEALTPQDMDDIHTALTSALHDINTLQRTLEHMKTRHTIESDLLRAEVHSELVDREANAARVADRQRFLWERSVALPGQAAAGDRAAASAAYVEAALSALCPHSTPRSNGSEQLAAATV
jgi:hypothetical protein